MEWKIFIAECEICHKSEIFDTAQGRDWWLRDYHLCAPVKIAARPLTS